MKAYIFTVLAWIACSYGVHRLVQYFDASRWWIVAYGVASILLFIWLVARANKKKSASLSYPRA